METIFIYIIQGIILILIFFLYQKIQSISQYEKDFEKRVNEVEDLLSSFLLEIKDENEKFLKTVALIEEKEKEAKVNHTLNDNEVRLKEQQISDQQNNEKSNHSQKLQSDFQLDSISVNDRVDRPSIQAQVMHLYDQGYSINEIAKKFNKGNTEIELIVKFNQKMME